MSKSFVKIISSGIIPLICLIVVGYIVFNNTNHNSNDPVKQQNASTSPQASSITLGQANSRTITNAINGTLKITGKAKCIAKNSVGNDWTKTFYINGEEFNGTKKLAVNVGDTISLGCKIVEHDKYPDVGQFTESIQITSDMISKGFTLTKTVYVKEGHGRYAGNRAEYFLLLLNLFLLLPLDQSFPHVLYQAKS